MVSSLTTTTTQNPTTTTASQTLSITTMTAETTTNSLLTITTTTVNLIMTTTSQSLTTTTEIITTQPIITNYYIQFSFPLNVSDQNITDTQLVSQLMSIFTTALSIASNQLNIIITTGLSRTTKRIVAQVRFFSTNTESADDLLTQTQKQLADPSSKIRQQTLTSQLNENSIENVQRYYTCSNGILQQSSCTTSETSTSGSSLSVILIASIIPSVIGFILLIIVAFLIVKYIRGRPFKVRTTRFDRF
jgi:hypothetical protein